MLELFAVHLQRHSRWFVVPRWRECSNFCTAEQSEANLKAIVNEFDWLMADFFMPDA